MPVGFWGFLILYWRKIELDEKFYVHESQELLMSLHSENVQDQAHYAAMKYYYWTNINKNFPSHVETVMGMS